jgi:hypothetical protein
MTAGLGEGMLVISNTRECRNHSPVRRKRYSGSGAWLAIALLPLIAACTSSQIGPHRAISIEEDIVAVRPAATLDGLTDFYKYSLTKQAIVRNEIITMRMYLADMEYHKYEAKLTREMQEEGLAATLISLGLTGSASLLKSATTDRILAGVATAVTGADKAYNEKELLSNTIQALQAQMRADRKAQAATIYASMLRDGQPTPIEAYPLAQALSDVDLYYQAGTVASALVGLNRTVANAEQSADLAKANKGPNPQSVVDAKTTAVPILANAPAAAPVAPPPPRIVVAAPATDTSYKTLRALLFPNGKLDTGLRDYAQTLVGPKVPVGVILTTSLNPNFPTLRIRIAACIIAHQHGQDCQANSLADLVQ